jgi:hypothetical protein
LRWRAKGENCRRFFAWFLGFLKAHRCFIQNGIIVVYDADNCFFHFLKCSF